MSPQGQLTSVTDVVSGSMHQWFLLLLTQWPDGAWTLTGHEGEQNVLLHGAFAAKAVPADSSESFVSVGQLYVGFWAVKKWSWLISNSQGMRGTLGL